MQKQLDFIRKIDCTFFSKIQTQDQLDDCTVLLFQEIIYEFYHHFGRDFVWRKKVNPYTTLVSEIMLQQTQTYRVDGKFQQFVATFPDFDSLARASLADVLQLWQGLGYSRRAKALHVIAQKVISDFNGQLPSNEEILQSFSGIGPATAASICAFAFNMPTVFIETNIRSVFTQFFFEDKQDKINDKQILPFVARTVDYANPRAWYYALTDYGVSLKKLYPRINARSAHYAKQSRFEGSNRQIRGEILRIVVAQKKLEEKQLFKLLTREHKRVRLVLEQLINEKFICRKNGILTVA